MSPKSLNGSGTPATDATTPSRSNSSPLADAPPLADSPPPPTDAHGRAALLLIENLIHELVEKAILTRGQAIDVIDIAVDVEHEIARAAGQWWHAAGSPLAPLAATFRGERPMTDRQG